LGDAHDATHGFVVHAHLVEDEEEGVVGSLEFDSDRITKEEPARSLYQRLAD